MNRRTLPWRGLLYLTAIVGAAPAVQATTAEGRTAGTFAVSSTGGATYLVPIWAPPGPQGVQPHISLSYSSQSGDGPVGVGWSLGGLSGISRCNKTYAQDTTPAAVALVTTDGYCLDGNRLRLTGGTYGTTGSTYQTEVANFSNVIANGTAGNGPAYFTVQARNGLTYQYGYTDANGNGANSQVLASGTTTADYWLLSKVIDRAGNNLVINYTTLTGTAVPSKILWTPTSAGASTYAYAMQFNYTANVPQSSIYKYVGGTPVTDTQLLSSITVAYSGTIVKNYVLGYEASPTTGADRLISVKECADSGATNCLLPTAITYQNGAAGVSTTASTAVSGTAQNVQWLYDLNGDGYPDLVYSNGTTMYVAFGSASGYGTPITTGIGASNFGSLADLLGTGKDGILANNGGTCYFYTWNGSSFSGVSTGVTGCGIPVDVNGDGRPDFVTSQVQNIGGGEVIFNVKTRMNTSSGSTVSFSSTLSTYQVFDCLNCTNFVLYSPPSGGLRAWDFNGDGRQDLAATYQLIINNNYTTYYDELISDGTNFAAVPFGSAPGLNPPAPPAFVNWNNDACTDALWHATLYIAGCSSSAPATLSVPGTILTTMDWDGDSRTDILVANGSTMGCTSPRG